MTVRALLSSPVIKSAVFIGVVFVVSSTHAQQPTSSSTSFMSVDQSFAVAHSESAALLRIAFEIEQLKPLIAEARGLQDAQRRYRFQYDWLLRDLERIKHGLEDAAYGAGSVGPRHVEPIRGAYQQ